VHSLTDGRARGSRKGTQYRMPQRRAAEAGGSGFKGSYRDRNQVDGVPFPMRFRSPAFPGPGDRRSHPVFRPLSFEPCLSNPVFRTLSFVMKPPASTRVLRKTKCGSLSCLVSEIPKREGVKFRMLSSGCSVQDAQFHDNLALDSPGPEAPSRKRIHATAQARMARSAYAPPQVVCPATGG